MQRNPQVKWDEVDEVIYGCANQAGEDNRNVARMAGLLSGLPMSVPGTTLNRLCGSGMDAIGAAARAVKAGESELVIAGGVESMSRAPFVMNKATEAFSRAAEIHDTTIGWRFVNPLMKAQYGVDSMPETAENLAEDKQISRADQDAFAFRSQARAAKAIAAGRFAKEIVAYEIKDRKGNITRVERDTYADRVWLDSCMAPSEADLVRVDSLDANAVYTAAYARWDRARAIVDAAVLFVEAIDCTDVEAASAAQKKLRALERGEDA
jgi:acetyl-CoA acetyltransferase